MSSRYMIQQREREREREKEREIIYQIKHEEKYLFFEESCNTWMINVKLTAWNSKKVEKERIYDITCMARLRKCYDNHDGKQGMQSKVSF